MELSLNFFHLLPLELAYIRAQRASINDIKTPQLVHSYFFFTSSKKKMHVSNAKKFSYELTISILFMFIPIVVYGRPRF